MEKENHNPFTPFPEFTQFKDVNLDTKVCITKVRQFLWSSWNRVYISLFQLCYVPAWAISQGAMRGYGIQGEMMCGAHWGWICNTSPSMCREDICFSSAETYNHVSGQLYLWEIPEISRNVKHQVWAGTNVKSLKRKATKALRLKHVMSITLT